MHELVAAPFVNVRPDWPTRQTSATHHRDASCLSFYGDVPVDVDIEAVSVDVVVLTLT